MDRVLLVFDDLQYSGHLEMTLRKVGFDTETITNEYNLSEKLLTFNPDYIIVKGATSRVSSLSMGKKLKDSLKYNGRVILIFPVDAKPTSEDLVKIRMDLLLFEPLSALRLVAHLLSLTTGDNDAIMDKLLRIAHTDPQFRQNEQNIIQNTGASIDAEIQFISNRLKGKSDGPSFVAPDNLDDDSIQSFVDPNFIKEENIKAGIEVEKPEPPPAPVETRKQTIQDVIKESLNKKAPEAEIPENNKAVGESALDSEFAQSRDSEYGRNLINEVEEADSELPLRIETYNHDIKALDQDLKKGLIKRQTKIAAKETAALSKPDEKKQRDDERRNFVKALWKKD